MATVVEARGGGRPTFDLSRVRLQGPGRHTRLSISSRGARSIALCKHVSGRAGRSAIISTTLALIWSAESILELPSSILLHRAKFYPDPQH